MNNKTLRVLAASDERQFLLEDNYEIYEKIGPPTGAVSFHSHDFHEIIYILDGDFDTEAGERLYHLKKGDFLLLPAGLLHRYHPVPGEHLSSRRIILWIRQSLLDDLAGKDGDLSTCFAVGARALHFPIYYEEQLRNLLLALASGEKDPLKKLRDKGNLLLFFCHLSALCSEDRYNAPGEQVARAPFIRTVDAFMEAHLEEELSLDLLASQVNLSKYYFLRLFKEETGITVHKYLVRKRLQAACRLMENGTAIGEVWKMTGFSDYSVFLKDFRSIYRESPREYLKSHTLYKD